MDHLAHESHTAHSSSSLGWLLLLVLLISGLAYLRAASRQSQRNKSWSPWRTVSFITGLLVLAVALAPPLATDAHNDPRGHMVQHLLIGMFAPLGIVLAAPVTLLLRTVPVAWGRRVASILRGPVVHVVGHPVTALVLNIGGMYLLYATPLYAATLTNPLLHALVLVHFLAAGYLFAWAIAGPDPAPGRPGLGVRLVVLIASIGLHAALGKLMYAHLWPSGTPYDPQQIQEAAVLMYYGGDLAEILLAIALFAGWYRSRQRRFARHLGVYPAGAS